MLARLCDAYIKSKVSCICHVIAQVGKEGLTLDILVSFLIVVPWVSRREVGNSPDEIDILQSAFVALLPRGKGSSEASSNGADFSDWCGWPAVNFPLILAVVFRLCPI